MAKWLMHQNLTLSVSGSSPTLTASWVCSWSSQIYILDTIILSGYDSFNLSISDYLKTHSACMWPWNREQNTRTNAPDSGKYTVELKDWPLLISVSHFSTVGCSWGGLSGLRLTSLLASQSLLVSLQIQPSLPCSSPLRTLCGRDVCAWTTCQIDDVNLRLNNLS